MITSQAVNEAIDYILYHIDEDISLEKVANYCHFSKYYFCRLFKEQTGEGVYEFIKRVRLEQSAFRLKVERERPITEISADYGYSSSNYSSAFKTHYHMTPISFRRKSYHQSMEHPFFHHENWDVENFEECNRKITVKNIPDYHVIYERRFGNYEGLCREWNLFIKKYEKYFTDKTKFLERTYDDPAVTEVENCLYDICMSVEPDCPLENTVTIQGGKCAIYHFKSHMKHIYAAYQTIFLIWLPKTKFEVDTRRSLFDIYHTVNYKTKYMELDICVPIRDGVM